MAQVNHTPGRFVWHELATPDVEKSKKFYTAVLGWTFNEMPMPEGTYTMAMNGETPMGGVFDLNMMPREGVPPHWLSYVSVPNVDEAASAAASAGGTVAMKPFDIPTVGRASLLGDPTHAYSMAFKSKESDPTPKERPDVGDFCWDTLNTTDIEGAKAFYQKVYGWKIGDFHGMPTFLAGETAVSDIQEAQGGAPSHWLPFVVVKKLDTANETVAKLGGKVIVEPMKIPDVGTMSVVFDDVGAAIGLLEP